MTRSGASAYAKIAQGFNKALQKYKKMAPPKVISDLVIKALKAKRPKTRYSAGTAAAQMLFLRKIVSDRMFDRLLRQMMK